MPAYGNQVAVSKFPHFARDRVSALAYTSKGEKLTMRTILSFIRQNSLSCKLRLRMRLIGPLGLLVATAIFASPGKALIADTPPPPMPGLRGEAAAEYLKQQGLYGSLGEAVKVARYGVYPSSPREGEERGEAFYADNPDQSWRAVFTPDGLTLRGGSASGAGWEFMMKLRSAGYGERQMAVSAGRLIAKGSRIEYERTVRVEDRGLGINPQSAITEWYVNKAEGLEQGFELAAPVAERVGEEPLVLRLELAGDLHARAEADGQSVTLLRKRRERSLTYDHLAVRDAKGRKLAAHLEAAGSEARIVVDDRGASYPVTIDPSFSEVRQLTASDGAAGDVFGHSVAIYADTVIVGAFQDITDNIGQGSAYIFERSQGGDNNWSEVKKLFVPGGERSSFFGISVAIYKDTAIVGSSQDNLAQGAVYIYERNQGGPNNWGQVKKLTSADGLRGDIFGNSVAIYEDTAIVGAPDDTTVLDSEIISDHGSAYIFGRNQGGANNWGEVKKLTASDAASFDRLGVTAAIYEDTVIVGATGDNNFQGSAYIFGRNQGGANNWGEVKKLTASDGAGDDTFGGSVTIYEDTVIVGAYFDDIGSKLFQGSAYIFERNQGGADNWGEVKHLTASDGAANDTFGRSVAIYEDTAIVGASRSLFNGVAPSSAYVFGRNQGGANNWGEVEKLTASDGATFDQFGVSAAIYEDTVIIGADTNDIGNNVNQGSAYVFFAVNTPPAISAAPVTRAEGDPSTNSTIATVSDPDQAADALAVTVNGSTSATVNGVTVSNITVNASGEVRADVVAACGASNAGFTLRVTDSKGLFAEATLDVTVTPENVAPTITLRPAISLWPPDHEYSTVTIAQMVESVSDNCSLVSLGDVVIEKVTSDEPDNSLDDGNTTNDIVIAPDCRSIQLRAERAGTGDGRVYTITLRLMDGRGNVTRRDYEVSVPIEQNGVPAVKGATAHTVTGGCQ